MVEGGCIGGNGGGMGGKGLECIECIGCIGCNWGWFRDGLGMAVGVWCIHGLGREILVWTCMGKLVWMVWIDIAVFSRRWVVWWVCG